MLEVAVVEHFDVERARLWDALSDLEAHRDWMPDVRTLRFLTEQRSGAGTRYVIEVGPLRVRDHIEVTTWTAPSELAIAHRIGPARGEGRLLLDVEGAGTRLEWRTHFEVPWWLGGEPTARLSAPATRRLLTRNLRSLRRWLAERQ